MKKALLSVLLCILLLSGCSSRTDTEADNSLHLLATTYPIYLLTCAVTQGADHVEVNRLITQELSCLHNYTLTVPDMKAIEKADVLLLNGGGLEDFLSDALSHTAASVIECSDSIALLEEADGEPDPHIWMSPENASVMLETIARNLSELDPDQAALYQENAEQACGQLSTLTVDLSDLACPYLITFHDGFQYFAQSTGLTLLCAIEEEEGSEASAAEIKELVSLIRDYHIPAIFTEKNGSDSTANAVARETGVAVYQLDMLMSGDGTGLSDYITAMQSNYAVLEEALS